MENEAAYHTGTFNVSSYCDKIDAIKSGDLSALNKLLSEEGTTNISNAEFTDIQKDYIDNINNIIAKTDGMADVTYGLKGKAAPMKDLSGGAEQFLLPLKGIDLETLGIIRY